MTEEKLNEIQKIKSEIREVENILSFINSPTYNKKISYAQLCFEGSFLMLFIPGTFFKITIDMESLNKKLMELNEQFEAL